MINLYNRDCLEAMREMEDNAYDLAVCDPPYGIKRFEKNVKSKYMKWADKKLENWDKRPSEKKIVTGKHTAKS